MGAEGGGDILSADEQRGLENLTGLDLGLLPGQVSTSGRGAVQHAADAVDFEDISDDEDVDGDEGATAAASNGRFVPSSQHAPIASAPPTPLDTGQPAGAAAGPGDTAAAPPPPATEAALQAIMWNPAVDVGLQGLSIATLGRITLQSEEKAASVLETEYALSLPEDVLAKAAVDVINFTEALFPPDTYTVPGLSVKQPGARARLEKIVSPLPPPLTIDDIVASPAPKRAAPEADDAAAAGDAPALEPSEELYTASDSEAAASDDGASGDEAVSGEAQEDDAHRRSLRVRTDGAAKPGVQERDDTRGVTSPRVSQRRDRQQAAHKEETYVEDDWLAELQKFGELVEGGLGDDGRMVEHVRAMCGGETGVGADEDGLALCCLVGTADWEADIEWGDDSKDTHSSGTCAHVPGARPGRSQQAAFVPETDSDSDGDAGTQSAFTLEKDTEAPPRGLRCELGWENARRDRSANSADVLPGALKPEVSGRDPAETMSLDTIPASRMPLEYDVQGYYMPNAQPGSLLPHYSRTLARHDVARLRDDGAAGMDEDASGQAAGDNAVPQMEGGDEATAAGPSALQRQASAEVPAHRSATPSKDSDRTESEATKTDDDAGAHDATAEHADAEGGRRGSAELAGEPEPLGPPRPPPEPDVAEYLEQCNADLHDPLLRLDASRHAFERPIVPSIASVDRTEVPSLNLNDPTLLFETLPQSAASAPALPARALQSLKDAPARVLEPVMQSRPTGVKPPAALIPGNPIAEEFAALNVSNEAQYQKRRRGRIAGMSSNASALHAPIAANLSQLPYPASWDRESLVSPHRPRHSWDLARILREAAANSEDIPATNVRLTFRSLPGCQSQFEEARVSAAYKTLGEVWLVVEKEPVFSDDLDAGAEPMLIQSIPPDAWYQFEAEDMDKTLNELSLTHNHEVFVLFRRIHLLQAPRLLKTLPSQPTALQALYGTRKKLSCTQWFCYAVEHMLPNAYVLGHTGMGATLQTFYRKRTEGDNDHLGLLNAADASDAWRVGQVTALSPDDPSPFRIGNIEKGRNMLTFESGGAIALAGAHSPEPKKFLLIRRPNGHVFLRTFTGAFTVGQQQPKVSVFPPASQASREVEESRVVAWVHRLLRKNQKRLAQADAEARPSISFSEVCRKFAPDPLAAYSGIDVNLTPAAVQGILAKRCYMIQAAPNSDEWLLAEGARIHTEDELRSMIGPDAVCALESMRSGLVTLDAVGLRRYEELSKCPMDKLRAAVGQLPLLETWRQAALTAIYNAMSAPWSLTENFLVCTKKDTQKMFLSISGLGDPSGRGIAMSYLKNMKRMGRNAVNRLLGKADSQSRITGTNADLRKLKTKEAGEKLKQLGLGQDVVDSLTRWERIGVLREMSTQLLQNAGVAPQGLGTSFARSVKVSLEDMRQRQFAAASVVLRRQQEFLTTGALPTSDDADLEVAPIGPAGEFDGVDEESAALLDIKSRDGDKDEPGYHGQLRLRRTFTYRLPGGTTVTRSFVLTNREEIFLVNSLYEKWDSRNEKLAILINPDGSGPTARTVDGRKGQLSIQMRRPDGKLENPKMKMFKNKKAPPRPRAAAPRPMPTARFSARTAISGAAEKAALRRAEAEAAAEAAAASTLRAPRAPKAPAGPRAAAQREKKPPKPKKQKAAEEDVESADTLAEELEDELELEDDVAGGADQGDPEFVEYDEGAYDDMSNSDLEDDAVSDDSDYQFAVSDPEDVSDDGGATTAGAGGRRRAGARGEPTAPAAGGDGGKGRGAAPAAAAAAKRNATLDDSDDETTTAPAASKGRRGRKAGSSGGPKESMFDEEEEGQLDDLIDDNEPLSEAEPDADGEEDYSSGEIETEDDDWDEEIEEEARPKSRTGSKSKGTSGSGGRRSTKGGGRGGGGGGGAAKRKRKQDTPSTSRKSTRPRKRAVDDEYFEFSSESEAGMDVEAPATSNESDEAPAPQQRRRSTAPRAAALRSRATNSAPSPSSSSSPAPTEPEVQMEPAAPESPEPALAPSAPPPREAKTEAPPKASLKIKFKPTLKIKRSESAAQPAESSEGAGRAASGGSGMHRAPASGMSGSEGPSRAGSRAGGYSLDPIAETRGEPHQATSALGGPQEPAPAPPAAVPAMHAEVVRGKALTLQETALKDMKDLCKNALADAKKLDNPGVRGQLHALFQSKPSKSVLPDYYDIVDAKKVVLWSTLTRRAYKSTDEFLSDLQQMHTNCRLYNVGDVIVHANGTKEKRGPGTTPMMIAPMYTEEMLQRAFSFFERPDNARQAEELATRLMYAHLLLADCEGGGALEVACDRCQRWRLIRQPSPLATKLQAQEDAEFTCDDDDSRPTRGCNEGLNRYEDRDVLAQAKAFISGA